MTRKEAIEKLDQMQSQIIHGSRIFGDIADVIRLEIKRGSAWADYAAHQEHCATCGEAVSDCYEGSELKRAAEEMEAQASNADLSCG